MWEKQQTTAGMENVAQDGMTFQCYSGKSDLKAVIELGSNWSQLHLHLRSGEFEYQSDLLDVSPLLPREVTAQLLREALERFLLLATLPYTKQSSSWPPLELILLLHQTLEHVLA